MRLRGYQGKRALSAPWLSKQCQSYPASGRYRPASRCATWGIDVRSAKAWPMLEFTETRWLFKAYMGVSLLVLGQYALVLMQMVAKIIDTTFY